MVNDQTVTQMYKNSSKIPIVYFLLHLKCVGLCFQRLCSQWVPS